MRTSEKRLRKSFAMRTCKIIGLKPAWNEQLQKYRGGLPLLAKQKARRQGNKEEGRQGTANRLLTPCLTQGENPSCFPASLPPCFLLRGRLECASILLWTAFAEGGEGSSGKMQKQACLAIIFLAGLAMGFQMTTGELEAVPLASGPEVFERGPSGLGG